MPHIAPFRAFYPDASLLEEMQQGRAFLRHRDILDDFDHWQAAGHILQTAVPGFYVVKIKMSGRIFRGMWCGTSLKDVKDRIIRGHERILPARLEQMRDTLQSGSMDVNPVIIYVKMPPWLSSLIKRFDDEKPLLQTRLGEREISIWQTGNEELNEDIVLGFAGLGFGYIADGHHRAATLLDHELEMGLENTGPATFFSSLYLDEAEVQIEAIHRVIRNLADAGLSGSKLLENLETKFSLTQTETLSLPSDRYTLSLGISGTGYYLLTALADESGAFPEVSPEFLAGLFESLIPGLLFEYAGGPGSLDFCLKLLGTEPDAAVFMMYPVSIAQITAIADAGLYMPAKSSWFEPKMPSGLLMKAYR